MKRGEKQFASDNYSGICPEALEYLNRANHGHDLPYGDDAWTREACDAFRDIFETDCDVFFVFNGTASNSLALASICQPYNSIIANEFAHIETDECGAPEFYSNGAKILHGKGSNGKLIPDSIAEAVTKRTDIHYPKPKAISVTEATELGTVYTQRELIEIQKTAKSFSLKVHMDGARFANAVASLDCRPREISWQAGVDVLCFGGTKNGLAGGEAVVFFDKALAKDFAYRCKQTGQLASKMRFIAAPWVGILKSGAWLKNAENSNRMAALLEAGIREIPSVEIMFPREANSVFVKMPEHMRDGLQSLGWRFYSFIGAGGIRFMSSWDTDETDVKMLCSDIRKLSNVN